MYIHRELLIILHIDAYLFLLISLLLSSLLLTARIYILLLEIISKCYCLCKIIFALINDGINNNYAHMTC